MYYTLHTKVKNKLIVAKHTNAEVIKRYCKINKIYKYKITHVDINNNEVLYYQHKPGSYPQEQNLFNHEKIQAFLRFKTKIRFKQIKDYFEYSGKIIYVCNDESELWEFLTDLKALTEMFEIQSVNVRSYEVSLQCKDTRFLIKHS